MRPTGDERRRDTANDRQALTGEERVRFERGVLPHLDAAYNLARHLLRDPDDAADAVQEAALLAVRNFASFRGAGGSGRAWLLAIVRNTCLSHVRRRKARGESVPFDEDAPPPAAADLGGDDGPAADFLRTVAAEMVRREVDRLPGPFREAIVLRELEDLSYKEIAEITGAPIGTVMSRLARARRQLAAALAKEGGGT